MSAAVDSTPACDNALAESTLLDCVSNFVASVDDVAWSTMGVSNSF